MNADLLSARPPTLGEPDTGSLLAVIDIRPESVTIGVVAGLRGKGVGLGLLEDLATEASRAGVTALSLSVEEANPAMRLYGRQGYVVVREVGDAATMRLDLRAK